MNKGMIWLMRDGRSLTMWIASFNFNWIEEEAGSTSTHIHIFSLSRAMLPRMLFSIVDYANTSEKEPIELIERAAKIEPLSHQVF